MQKKILSDDLAGYMTNPWVRYAGWPAFLVGALAVLHESLLSPRVFCKYFPGLYDVRPIPGTCEAMPVWRPAAEIITGIVICTLIFTTFTSVFRRRLINPAYFFGVFCLTYVPILVHGRANALYVSTFMAGAEKLGPIPGKFAELFWEPINLMFAVWVVLMIWNSIREIGGLVGWKLMTAFILSYGIASALTSFAFWVAETYILKS